jgi:signal transduction histidine kinase
VAACIVTLFINQRVLQPVRELSKAMNKVASGDFKVRLEQTSHIQDIKDIYDHFNTMTAALDKTEMLQSDFVSNVSHEFKTPINAIEGYAMLLQDTTQTTAEQVDYVENILLNTKRLSDLIGNILLLSRLDNQITPESKSNFRLDEQIRQSILMLENQWEPKEIEFDVELEEISYYGNESMLLQVWSNLISNAVKFDPYAGLIRIELKKTDDRIICLVEDEGPGIAEADMPHIFDKFYQSDSSHKQEGNGLGLALVKRIIALYHGQIHVENLPERGCRFTVELPVAGTGATGLLPAA